MLLVKRSPDEDQANKGSKPSEEKPEQQDNVALAKALKEARENSVSKEEYERVVNENKKLVSEIINGDGGAGNGQANPPEKADIKALREELYGPKGADLNNLDFWKRHSLSEMQSLNKKVMIPSFLMALRSSLTSKMLKEQMQSLKLCKNVLTNQKALLKSLQPYYSKKLLMTLQASSLT